MITCCKLGISINAQIATVSESCTPTTGVAMLGVLATTPDQTQKSILNSYNSQHWYRNFQHGIVTSYCLRALMAMRQLSKKDSEYLNGIMKLGNGLNQSQINSNSILLFDTNGTITIFRAINPDGSMSIVGNDGINQSGEDPVVKAAMQLNQKKQVELIGKSKLPIHNLWKYLLSMQEHTVWKDSPPISTTRQKTHK